MSSNDKDLNFKSTEKAPTHTVLQEWKQPLT